MKNKLLLLGITLLCLTGCENAPKKDKENNTNNSEINNKTPESKPDEGTPQWWLDMLTCNNVTIKDTHKTLGSEVIYFKYVEGKVYKIEESSTLNSLTYGDIYEFSDWGETTI